jgi:hypothetical protein
LQIVLWWHSPIICSQQFITWRNGRLLYWIVQ